jgi:hypothetical protein
VTHGHSTVQHTRAPEPPSSAALRIYPACESAECDAQWSVETADNACCPLQAGGAAKKMFVCWWPQTPPTSPTHNHTMIECRDGNRTTAKCPLLPSHVSLCENHQRRHTTRVCTCAMPNPFCHTDAYSYLGSESWDLMGRSSVLSSRSGQRDTVHGCDGGRAKRPILCMCESLMHLCSRIPFLRRA